jgi:heat shock protein HtpX
MQYIGLQSQIWKNNSKSLLLLILFPLVLFGLIWLFFFFTADPEYRSPEYVTENFITFIPWISLGVIIWFVVAWFTHSALINAATSSMPLERKNNFRIYNMVENLCISVGMKMPKINIIEDNSLNAFASGLNSNSFTISLSRGIIDRLNDEELEGVIAHELTHIRNRDVRLLIISIVFVGIFAFVSEALFRSMRFGRMGRGKKEGAGIIIALLLAVIGYFLASLFRFAISRKREYLADAGAVELTRNPLALASALKKISADPTIEAVTRRDVAQMFIENPQLKDSESSLSFSSLFATHPPIEKRIKVLEQF